MKGTTLQWIEDQKVPYATKNSEWVGFDTKESYETKVGGISALELDIFIANPKHSHGFTFHFCPNRCATCRSRSLVVPLCGLSIWMILQDDSAARVTILCLVISTNFLILVSSEDFSAEVYLKVITQWSKQIK